MVVKSIITSILNKYVGKYVKNFDSDNLNIGLWDGKVVLSDLEFCEEALVGLDLPIEVLSGYIGNLSLNIPWKSIYVDPVDISVEDVFIITGPRNEIPYDEEKERRYINAQKQIQLKTIEKAKKYQQKREETEDDENDTLLEKLQAQILKNVQISIKNIHVRYEDKITNPESPFTIGVSLYEVTAKTTDSNWLPTYVDGSVRKIHKLLQMKNLGFYWNSNDNFFYSQNPTWKSVMRSQITTQQGKVHNHQYILEPLSMIVKMEIDEDANILMELPKYVMSVVLENLPLSLSKSQFNEILNLADSFSMMEINQEYRKFKPLVSVKSNPKAWWKYVFDSIIEKVYKPWTWKWIKEHREKYKNYLHLYLKKLKAEHLKEEKTLPLIMKKIKEQEENLDVANILIARQQAFNDFELEKKNGLDLEEQERIGWMEWLGVTSSSTTIVDDIDDDKMFSLASLSEEEKQQLYTAIGYVNDTSHPVYSKEYIRSKLSISLDCCTISLKDPDKKAAVSLSLKKMFTTVTERPGSEGYGFEFCVENISSYQIDSGNIIDIFKSRERDADNLLSMNFDINPVDSNAYYTLRVALDPIHVNFHKSTVEILTNILNVEDDEMLKELKQSANQKVAELTSASRAGVEHLIMNNKILHLDFNIKSPIIVISNRNANDRRAIYIYLGDLTVKTIMNTEHQQQSVREATESDLEVMFYQQTDIQLSNTHMGISQYDEECGILEEISGDDEVIPAMSLNINVYRCLKAGYANFPDFKISSELPLLRVNLIESNIVYLHQIIIYFTQVNETEVAEEIQRQSNSPLHTRRRSGSVFSELSMLQDVLNQTKPFKDVERPEHGQIEGSATGPGIDVTDSSYQRDSSMGSDRTKLVATLEIHKIEFSYSAVLNGSIVNLLNLNLVFASCDVEIHMWDIQVKARFNSFEIEDKSTGEGLSFISSLDSQDLMQFEFVQADSKGPEFQEKFNKTAIATSVTSSGISVFVKQSSLKQLMNTLQKLMKSISETSESSSPHTSIAVRIKNKASVMINPLVSIPEDDEVDIETKTSLEKLEEAVMGKINFKFDFHLKYIGMTLATDTKELAHLVISDINSKLEVTSNLTEVTATLKGIKLLDKATTTLYPEILKEDSTKLMKGKVIIYKDVSRLTVNPDVEIDMHFGKLIITVNVDFIVSVLNLLTEITFNDDIIQPSQVNDDDVTLQLPVATLVNDHGTQTFTKLKFDVGVEAPSIILPKSPHAQDHMLMDLGRFNVKNEIQCKETVFVDNIIVAVDEVKILSFINGITSEILVPFSLEMICDRFMNLSDPAVEINVKLPMFQGKLYNRDVSLLVQSVVTAVKALEHLSKEEGSRPTNASTMDLKDDEWNEDASASSLSINVDVGKVVLDAYNDAKDDQPLVSIISDNFRLKLEQETSLTIGISLQNISCVENHTLENDVPVALLTSKSDGNIASFHYTKDDDGNQHMLLDVSDISLYAHDVCIKNVVSYAEDLLERLEPLFDMNSTNDTKHVAEELPETSLNTKLNFVCNLKKISTLWNLHQITFASAHVLGLNFIFESDEKGMVMTTKLENMSVEDLRPDVVYPNIVLLEDQNLLTCKFTMAKNEESLKSGSLWLRIGRIKIVFIYKFISEILESIQPFISLGSNFNSKTDLDVTGKIISKKHEVASTPFLLHLDVDITAPLIYLPKFSTSSLCVVADLGKLNVSNTFIKNGGMNEEEMEDEIFGIDLILAKLSNIKLTVQNDGQESIVSKDLSTTVQLSRKIFLIGSKTVLKIEADIVPVVVTMAETDIQLFMVIVQCNLNEGNRVPDDQPVKELINNGEIEVKVEVHRIPHEEGEGIDDNRSTEDINREETKDDGLELTIILHCELIQLHLKSNLLFKEINLLDDFEESVQMCIFSIENTRIVLTMSGGDIHFDLDVKEISGDDVRPHSLASFKRVLERRLGRSESVVAYPHSSSSYQISGTSKTSQVSLKYSSNKQGQEISVVVIDARTFVNLEFMQDLFEFISLALSLKEERNNDSKKQQELNKTRHAEEKQTENVGKTSNLQQLRVTCHLDDTEIILLKDPRCPITPSFVGHVEVDVEYLVQNNKSSVTVPTARIGILYGEYPNLRETARPLLIPCELKCLVNMSEETGTDIQANVHEMKFSLSPSILSTLIQIADDLIRQDNGEEPQESSSTCYVDWTPQPLLHDNLNDADDEAKSVAVSRTKPTKTECKEKVKINLDMIELTLGNDLEGMVVPLLFTRFSASTSVTNWTSRMSLDTDLTIEISHYNEKLGAWEPLLEPNTENNQLSPYELIFKMFYGDSEKLDFSTGYFEDANELTFGDEDDTVKESEESALYLVVSSDDVMQLTITENTFAVVNNFLQGWTMSALRNSRISQLVAPYQFENNLGLPVIIYLEDQNQASIASKDGLTKFKTKARQLQLEGQESHRFNPWKMKDVNKKTFIDIQVGEFGLIKNVNINKAGIVIHNLVDEEGNPTNRMVLNVVILNGRRLVGLNSAIKICNKISQLIFVTAKLGSNPPMLELKYDHKACLPLKYIIAKNIYLQLETYRSADKVDFFKLPKEKILKMRDESNSTKFIKVLHKVFEQSKDGHLYLAPIHYVKLVPPIKLCNRLPVQISITLRDDEDNGRQHSYILNAGDSLDVLEFDVSRQTLNIGLKCTDEDEHTWEGKCIYNENSKESARITMKSYDLNQSMEFEVASERINTILELSLYSAFWIVNKTGLNINFKVNQGSDVYTLKSANDTRPQIVYYEKRKKTKGTLQCNEGEWCENFSLSAISDENHIDLFSKENRLYSIHVSIVLSKTRLTNIITLSPRCTISNHTEITILFGEYNSAIDKVAWNDLLPGQCSPCWLHTQQSEIVIKEEDSAFYGSPIHFNEDSKYALRLSSSKTVCVDVNHLGERLIMNVANYQNGCIPARVDNYSHLPVFLQQEGTTGLSAIKEYPRNMSQFYNWASFEKPFNLKVMYGNPADSYVKNVNIQTNGWGVHYLENEELPDDAAKKELCFLCRCLSCLNICEKHRFDEQDGRKEASHLLSPTSMDNSPRDHQVYWVSYLEGMQRVLAFTSDFRLAKRLHKTGELDYLSVEIFLSLQGVGISLLNKVPIEIAYASLTGGTSVWEVEVKNDSWKGLDVDTSMFLEDSWKNNVEHARLENKIEADIDKMVMVKPMKGQLRRSRDPALWIEYRQSKSNSSVYIKLHRIQVDSQQYDVLFPSVLYPTPLPENIVKRNGSKPMLELSAVFTALHDVIIFKYFKLLLQEVNVKIDRPILTGVMGLYSSEILSTSHSNFFKEDTKDINESTQEKVEQILVSQSTKVLMLYFHLSPIKLHLSFSLENHKVGASNKSAEAKMLELLISTVGIHFTDISDVVIKLAFFERRNAFLSQEMLLADVTKHYALQAIKQFHVLVLGLDALGNPYGLITEYGKGFKDLFYEPYLGSVGGPHKFAAGLATGVKSLLGHTIGGTAGAAALITEQLGQVVAALSFDSEYKRRRRREMRNDPSGLGEGLAIGGKQFVMGLVFGVSGLVTNPFQGAKDNGIEGFFKGIGRGLIGLLVKPTGGVIDLVTSSLDGVRRFAEQSGEDIVVRMRLPRLTYPYEPVSIYSSEKSFGSSIFRVLLTVDPTIEGIYKEHQVIPSDQATIVVFTNQAIIKGVQTKFFAEWSVDWLISYRVLQDVQIEESVVVFSFQTENGIQEQRMIDINVESVRESLLKKTELQWSKYKRMVSQQREHVFLRDYVII